MAAELYFGLSGLDWAILGATVAVVGGGIGSSVGIAWAATVSGGVLGEDPDKFAGILALCALPGTQGFYGFISGMLVMVFFELFGGGGAKLSGPDGFHVFLACLPVMFNCAISGILQGKTSLGATGMVARRGDTGRAIIFPALVETYAVLSLIITILLLLAVRAAIQ